MRGLKGLEWGGVRPVFIQIRDLVTCSTARPPAVIPQTSANPLEYPVQVSKSLIYPPVASSSFAAMPTTSSPTKRPGMRRAVSSQAVVTRTNSGELSQSHTSRAPAQHKPHRAHVVGGGHRHHHRNPSFGKNLNKLQRFQLGPEATGRHHIRKKSAPATPVASPKGSTTHVHWAGAVEEEHPKNHSMKRNNSTPALRRTTSGFAKKALVTDRPQTNSGKKKSVGFELGEDETDDAEWEDTTQSPESTRRNSVAPSTHSLENAAVLVDPLTFVKRPYPQMPRATSLPDSITKQFVRQNSDDEEVEEEEEEDEEREEDSDEIREANRPQEQGDVAHRLLSPSHSAKAPPAMSSISAMAQEKPSLALANSASRSASFLASGQDTARRNFSTSNLGTASMPGSHTQATSSSMEGGVSKFILNNKSGQQASFRNDSDPHSSFLPHYHPQTPPSPNQTAGKAAVSPARPRGVDLPSRTQQKLWLQRTAALNNSPPDTHGLSAATGPSAIDPTYMATGHSRTVSGAYDASKGMNGVGRVGPVQIAEARHIRKAYEKTSSELMGVRRFQSPTADSFNRLRAISRASKAPAGGTETGAGLGKPVKSAPSLTLLQRNNQPTRSASNAASKSRPVDPQSSSEDPATQSESNDTQAAKSVHPSHRIFSTSDEASYGLQADNEGEDYPAMSEVDLMIRRIWESREVATQG